MRTGEGRLEVAKERDPDGGASASDVARWSCLNDEGADRGRSRIQRDPALVRRGRSMGEGRRGNREAREYVNLEMPALVLGLEKRPSRIVSYMHLPNPDCRLPLWDWSLVDLSSGDLRPALSLRLRLFMLSRLARRYAST